MLLIGKMSLKNQNDQTTYNSKTMPGHYRPVPPPPPVSGAKHSVRPKPSGPETEVNRDLQGSPIIEGLHKDLHDNPDYAERFKDVSKDWRKKNK